ncbi:MAG: hypothetical protein ABFS35_17115 [Bacteroidota bacterium]
MAIGLISHSRMDEIVMNIHPDDFAEEFIKLVDAHLEKSYVFHRNIFKRRIDFKGSVFRFAWNGWNVFNTISNGEIEFESQDDSTFINHKIYFTEVFTISFLFTIIPLTMGGGWPLRLLVFSLIWLAYIASYLIGVYRFNSFISKTLIEVNLSTGYEFEDKSGIG